MDFGDLDISHFPKNDIKINEEKFKQHIESLENLYNQKLEEIKNKAHQFKVDGGTIDSFVDYVDKIVIMYIEYTANLFSNLNPFDQQKHYEIIKNGLFENIKNMNKGFNVSKLPKTDKIKDIDKMFTKNNAGKFYDEIIEFFTNLEAEYKALGK